MSSLTHDLRSEAFRLMEGRGDILEVAREVSRALAAAGLKAAVIGGVAVVLHGHIRTTIDVDVLVEPPLQPVVDCLAARGFDWSPGSREFVKDGVPVHLVLPEQTGVSPDDPIEIEGVRTVDLAQLLEMKLRSGANNVLRAQDLADVIGLIRRHGLTGAFTSRLPEDVRAGFRKLARAIEGERR